MFPFQFSSFHIAKRLAVFMFCIAFVFIASLDTFAQQTSPTPPPQDDDDVVNVESNLVQLNVGVADRKGQPVNDLTAADFVVYENGVKQTIRSFEPTATPFSLVLLLDTSGSTLNYRTTLKQAALRFIDALGAEDRVSVVTFNAKPRTLASFTNNRRKIADAITYADGSGITELYDAMQYSLKQLATEGKRRKAIVVLTDGKDLSVQNQDRRTAANATTVEEGLKLINPNENAVLRNVLNAADRQGVTIYPLATPTFDPKLAATLEPYQLAAYDAARARLETLANRSGGRLHEIRRLEDMGRLYAEVAADLRSLYSISYQPPSGGNSRITVPTWRTISIEVARPETIARTRQGYFTR